MKQNKEKFSSDPYQRYLQLLHQLIVSLQGDLALGPIIQKATRIIPEYLAVDRASILIYDEEAGGLISDQLLGAPRKAMLSALQPVNVGISGEAFSREALIFVEDCRQTELIEAKYVQQLDLKSVAAIPLRFREKALGVLRLDYTEETHVFTSEEQDFFMLLGEEVGILLGNVLLNSQKKKMANAIEKGEAKLAENLQLIKIAGETAKIGGWSVDLATNISYWSDTVADIHKMPRGFSPLVSEWIQFYAPEWQAKITEVFNLCVEKGIPYDEELEIINKDGERVWVRTIGEAVRDADGKIIKVQGAFQDINALKAAEKEQEMLKAQFQQAQKMESVGRLAGGVAHDYNNMLSVILGYSEMLLEDMTPEDTHYDNILEIYKAANRSIEITRQLLAFARKQSNNPLLLNLNETIEGMLKMLRRLIGEDITLIWKPAVHLANVMMDPSQIDQIMANLCVNARDAIKGVGEITIQTGHFSCFAPHREGLTMIPAGDYVLFSVSDTGSGMDEATLEKIFEPFFTTKEIGKGTGLGLATVYGIVNQNKGAVSVKSKVGEGTIFKIYLPKYSGEEGLQKTETVEEIPKGKGETVLIVEDAEAILIIAATLLEKLNYRVLAANSPNEALELAEKEKQIHLLLTDVIMPEMNGKELAEKLVPLHPAMKVIYMSGYTADIISEHGVLESRVNFIEKPLSLKKVAFKLHQALCNGDEFYENEI
jgi:two-component system, cell cycle sensor histidine kinase and response regulator CckA